MNKYALLACSITCLLAASSGCCHLQSAMCYPFGCIAICTPTDCCDAGCDTCGPTCAGDCVSACDPCGDPCAEPCGDACCDASCGPCDGCGQPCGPLSWLFGIFSWGYCGSGCGECYWSDFHSEPPDCCDPCDRCGNWTGGGYYAGCGQCGGWDGGCSACGGGYCQTPPRQTGYLAGKSSPNVNRGARPSTNRGSQGYVITDPSSRYAPRVVSVTERVVKPTPTKAAPVEQTAAKQVVTPRRAPVRR